MGAIVASAVAAMKVVCGENSPSSRQTRVVWMDHTYGGAVRRAHEALKPLEAVQASCSTLHLSRMVHAAADAAESLVLELAGAAPRHQDNSSLPAALCLCLASRLSLVWLRGFIA